MLLKQLPIANYKVGRQLNKKPKHPAGRNIAEQLAIKDAAMFLPLNNNEQINIYILQFRDEELQLDIRLYRKEKDKFVPTNKGIRIPAKLTNQLVARLKMLEKKYGK